MLFENTCVVCREDQLTFRPRKTVWGITSPKSYFCENCGSIFIEDELRWKFIHINNKLNPLWQQFHQKSFYVREWLSIGHLEIKPEIMEMGEMAPVLFENP